MRTLLLITAALILPQVPAFTQSCKCSEQFDWLQQKLALNYSGYRDKVTEDTRPDFERHTASFQEKIAASSTDTACYRLMSTWVKWLRDGHIYLGYKDTPWVENPDSIRRRFADREKIALTETEARQYLDQPGLDPVEGIYQNELGNYRVALIRNTAPGRDFAAVVLKADSIWWVPGQIKFDLKESAPGQYAVRFYLDNRSEFSTEATLKDGRLSEKMFHVWLRQYPGVPIPIALPLPFSIKQSDAVTLVFRVAPMRYDKRQVLDSLIKANRRLLERTPNLIIDCRGNRGGSNMTFAELRPYVYSGTARGLSHKVYSTRDNIEKYVLLQKNKRYSRSQRRSYGRLAKMMKKHEGSFIGNCEIRKNRPEKISPYPKKVAILIDGGCAGSCEEFIYYARQSSRVTLIGQNTAGVMDYGNVLFLDFPCGKFTVGYPTARSCRVDAGQGIDGIGIPPAVRIDDDKTDWVAFAKAYLEQK
ncbi:MAG: hypothetical protein IPK76_21755 [Lewinellaceae bacterium]|nr:hypothetical protein [Lewinellaceae bacterium]